jgi:hypothetical protein
MIEKSRKPFLTQVLFEKKSETKKQEKQVIFRVGHVQRLLRRKRSLVFLMCDPVKSFCSDGNGTPDEIPSTCLAQDDREVYA